MRWYEALCLCLLIVTLSLAACAKNPDRAPTAQTETAQATDNQEQKQDDKQPDIKLDFPVVTYSDNALSGDWESWGKVFTDTNGCQYLIFQGRKAITVAERKGKDHQQICDGRKSNFKEPEQKAEGNY